MKTIFKHAFLNIVRMPMRTVLCFLIAFITVSVTVVCGEIYSTVSRTKEDFKTSYPAVATVTGRSETAPNGTTQTYSPDLDVLMTLLGSDSIRAYNMSIYAGELAEDEIIHKLPDNSLISAQPSDRLVFDDEIIVTAVNNLMLTEPFYSGDSKIAEGASFSEEELRGGCRAMVISKYAADKFGLSVGDGVVLKYRGKTNYALYTVVGIYESERGMTKCYIPIEDHFRELVNFESHNANTVFANVKPDTFGRLDFLLTSADAARDFITDSLAAGFDTSKYEITVNDKPYKTVMQGLNDIETVTLFVLVSMLTVGAAVFFLVAFFYSSSRKRERTVLRALGMKNAAVSAMFILEFTVILAAALMTGYLAGVPATDAAITAIESGVLSESLSDANVQKEAVAVRDQRALTLQREIDISFSAGYSGLEGYIRQANAITDSDHCLRYESYWDGSRKITVTGTTKLDAAGFVNKASYEADIFKEGHRMTGYAFVCFVPENSEYKIGDSIMVTPHETAGTVSLREDGYENFRMTEVYLTVIGTYDSDKYEGIVMPMAELELLHDYLSLSSETYRTHRYDRRIEK